MSNHDLDGLEPDCEACRRPMMLSRVEPLAGQIGIERRTFECRWCPRTEHYVVETAGRITAGTQAEVLFKSALRNVRRTPIQ
jgi:hypothetical protein